VIPVLTVMPSNSSCPAHHLMTTMLTAQQQSGFGPKICTVMSQVMRMTPYDTPAKRAGDAAQPCIDPANFVTVDATVERGCDPAHQMLRKHIKDKQQSEILVHQADSLCTRVTNCKSLHESCAIDLSS